MRFSIVVAIMFIITSSLAIAGPGEVVSQSGDPGSPVVASDNKVEKAQVGDNANKQLVQPSQAQAVQEACKRGEAVASGGGQTIVCNYHYTKVVSSKDIYARQMADRANKNAKGFFALGGDGRFETLMRDYHVASWGDVDRKIATAKLNPALAPANANSTPRETGQGDGNMSVEWLILAAMIIGGVVAICFALRGPNTEGITHQVMTNCNQLVHAGFRIKGSIGTAGRSSFTVEPANATPLVPVAGQGSPVGQALVPVQFAPVTLTLGPATPAQPPQPAQVVAVRPAPPTQPAATASAPPPAPARPNRGAPARPTQPPAPGAGTPPAQPPATP